MCICFRVTHDAVEVCVAVGVLPEVVEDGTLVPDAWEEGSELLAGDPTAALALIARVVPDCTAHEIPPITWPRKRASYKSHEYSVVFLTRVTCLPSIVSVAQRSIKAPTGDASFFYPRTVLLIPCFVLLY